METREYSVGTEEEILNKISEIEKIKGFKNPDTTIEEQFKNRNNNFVQLFWIQKNDDNSISLEMESFLVRSKE